MEKQNIEVDKPIPSLPVSKVCFKNGKWSFVYSFDAEIKLTNSKRKTPLYLKGALCSMKIVKKSPKNSTNLMVSSIPELKELMDSQRESDFNFRKKFLEEHKDNIDEYQENIFVLDNKTQSLEGAYIVKVKRKRKDSTVFIGRC